MQSDSSGFNCSFHIEILLTSRLVIKMEFYKLFLLWRLILLSQSSNDTSNIGISEELVILIKVIYSNLPLIIRDFYAWFSIFFFLNSSTQTLSIEIKQKVPNTPRPLQMTNPFKSQFRKTFVLLYVSAMYRNVSKLLITSRVGH